MILRYFLFFVLLVTRATALDVYVDDVEDPTGAVLLVIDGLGSSYFYPEFIAYSLEGAPQEPVVVDNITNYGARVLDMRAPVPVTEPGHDVIVTGCSYADSDVLGRKNATIFDLARDEGYLCIAVMQRGDHIAMLLKQDAVLYFPDNSFDCEGPVPGFRSALSSDPKFEELSSIFMDLTSSYDLYISKSYEDDISKGHEDGTNSNDRYIMYNRFCLDAVTCLVEYLDDPFLIIANVGAVDSAGHNKGPAGYLDTVAGLDTGLGKLARECNRKGVLLMVTADHGMAFSSGKGGHASGSYAESLEAHRIPLMVQGPYIEELVLDGVYSQADIAPTLLQLMGIRSNLSMADGRALPLSTVYDLLIELPKTGDVSIYHDGVLVAEGSKDSSYGFYGLKRGVYVVSALGLNRTVVMNGDFRLDLRGVGTVFTKPKSDKPWWPLSSAGRRVMAIILIVIINAIGIELIVRIARNDEN